MHKREGFHYAKGAARDGGGTPLLQEPSQAQYIAGLLIEERRRTRWDMAENKQHDTWSRIHLRYFSWETEKHRYGAI